MDIIKIIRAEIDRRIDICDSVCVKERERGDNDMSTYYNGKTVALEELLSFLDTLQEPEISNELLEPTRAVRLPDGRWVTEKLARQIGINLLNKAADELALRAFPEKKSYSSVYDRVVDYNAVDRKNYRDGILAGAELMKKQMMEEAEEGTVEDVGVNYIDLIDFDAEKLGLVEGDKVRIIVLPKED